MLWMIQYRGLFTTMTGNLSFQKTEHICLHYEGFFDLIRDLSLAIYNSLSK